MGFRLKFFVVGTALALGLFGSSGCIRDIQVQDPDLGTEASPDDVSKAVGTATANISIMNAQPGQYVTYEENYRIGIGAVEMTKKYMHKVNSLVQDATSLTCGMHEDYYEFMPSGAPKDETHQDITLKFTKELLGTGPVVVSQVDRPQTELVARARASFEIGRAKFFAPRDSSLCDGTVKDDGDGIKYDCMKYYNLKFEERKVDAPTAVQAKAGCMGLNSCQIDGYYIEYDEVKFLTGQMVRRVRMMAHLSSEVPDIYYIIGADGKYIYTPASTSFCSLSIEKVDDVGYQVEFCSILRDFDYHPSAPMPVPTPTPSHSI